MIKKLEHWVDSFNQYMPSNPVFKQSTTFGIMHRNKRKNLKDNGYHSKKLEIGMRPTDNNMFIHNQLKRQQCISIELQT
jgi:hypothetical protein